MKKFGIAVLAFGVAGLVSASASAQDYEGGYMRAPVRAPREAFEVGVSTAYTQGFGQIYAGTGGNRIQDVANAGIGLGLNLSYRATPGFGIGVVGTYQGFKADNTLPTDTKTQGATGGVQADFHLMPYSRLDPWVSLGAAYRVLWISPTDPAPATLYHGFELAKLQVGADIRMSKDVALGPFVGADINMFVWDTVQGQPTVELSSKRVNTFIFAGLQGRFDIGGPRDAKLEQVTARR